MSYIILSVCVFLCTYDIRTRPGNSSNSCSTKVCVRASGLMCRPKILHLCASLMNGYVNTKCAARLLGGCGAYDRIQGSRHYVDMWGRRMMIIVYQVSMCNMNVGGHNTLWGLWLNKLFEWSRWHRLCWTILNVLMYTCVGSGVEMIRIGNAKRNNYDLYLDYHSYVL